MKTKDILRELSFLEQFLGCAKRISDSVASMQPAKLCVKYRALYSECRFAVNALKWRVEDDINKLGVEEDGLPVERKDVLQGDSIWEGLTEVATVVDAIVSQTEKQSDDCFDVSSWHVSYHREEGRLSVKFVDDNNDVVHKKEYFMNI